MPHLEEFEKSKSHFQVKSWLKSNKLGLRLLIGFIFVLFLTFFLQYREVRVEVLELGAIADKYLIAQVDFEFPDEEATVLFKQESLRDIGMIYRMDEKQVIKKCYELEEFLTHNMEWRKKIPKVTFEELYYGIEQIKNTLLQMRFTDERTLSRIKKFDLPVDNFFILSSDQFQEHLIFGLSFWEKIKKEAFEDANISSDAAFFLVDYFIVNTWNLQRDMPSERNLRQSIQEGLPEKFTYVTAGDRIIDSGEKITERHLAMLQAMKKAIKESRNLWQPLTILGNFLLALIFTFIAILFFRTKYPDTLHSLRKLTLIVTIALLTLVLSKVTEFFLLNQATKLTEFISYPLFVPFASLLLCVLLRTGIAFFVSIFLAVILSITLALEHDRFLILNLISAIVAIICARRMHKRKEIFSVCGKVWCATIPIMVAYNFIQNRFLSMNLIADLSSNFVFMAMTAILVIGLLPLFESLFHVMTDMSLMEYMDPNNELLRRLSVEAPGTYQHCLVVGALAERTAQAIGANGLFCRVATLYHDIGKLANPHYFTENQLGGLNIHQLLTPLESTQVIISHVTEGEALAKKYHLPSSFIDIIREHHGTTLVYYFFCKQVEQMGGITSNVDESKFRYPGPIPHSKESAIIMIVDSIEAASRSLTEINEVILTEIVERLVKEKIEDGQLDECQLTFKNLNMIKKTIIQTLLVTHHLRVRYPEKASFKTTL